MKTVYVVCEGPTEESFVNSVLAPFLLENGLCIIPFVIMTKRIANNEARGGVSTYAKIRKELILNANQHKNELVTTMLDYYGLPSDTPGIDNCQVDLYQRMSEIERAIERDVGLSNCFVHLMLHEFEALLFSDPSKFISVATAKQVMKIQQIRTDFPTPEHINNSPNTAPSKRLELIIPNYKRKMKVSAGTLVSKEIGIPRILDECKHFADWIDKMRTLASIVR